MKYPQGCIVQFGKIPRLGRVKTRLIPAIGPLRAMQLHQQLMEKTLDSCTAAALCPVELWVDGDPLENDFIDTIRHRYEIGIGRQRGKDLGQRMAHAVQNVLERYQFVILVGSDCPSLDCSHLGRAAKYLARSEPGRRNRVVIGPAEDGGYVLIGLCRVAPQLFQGIDWGSHHVLEQTVSKAEALSLCIEWLPSLWDVDREEDLARMEAGIADSEHF